MWEQICFSIVCEIYLVGYMGENGSIAWSCVMHLLLLPLVVCDWHDMHAITLSAKTVDPFIRTIQECYA